MKMAFLACRNAKHNCAGAADCMRMFHDRTGEFSVYGPEDTVCAVTQCDYCINDTESFAKHLKSWQSEKNGITHVHLCACLSLCPCGNYEEIKDYFRRQGMTIGEFHEK